MIIKLSRKILLKYFRLEIKYNGKLYKNVYNRKGNRRVLISYIVEPFLKNKLKIEHTNVFEVLAAASFFDKNGYIIDVVDFQSCIDIDYRMYDIIYGFGKPFENYFINSANLNKITIFYLTGYNPEVSNILSADRNTEFYFKYNILYSNSDRIQNYNNYYSRRLSSCLIILGDKSTYKSCSNIRRQNLYSIDSFFIKSKYSVDLDVKNYTLARKNFLWFGSRGIIHKGLDVLIEIFKKREDLNLYICGVHDSEINVLNTLLGDSNKSNIINCGFIDINTLEFANLMRTCAFCVFPSVSEGGSPSVLTAIANGGLIPIISDSCGLDSLYDFAFHSTKISVQIFDELITNATSLKIDDLKFKSKEIHQFVLNRYSYDNYKLNLELLLKKAISM